MLLFLSNIDKDIIIFNGLKVVLNHAEQTCTKCF